MKVINTDPTLDDGPILYETIISAYRLNVVNKKKEIKKNIIGLLRIYLSKNWGKILKQ